ncbi:hypothetical protein GGR54DRAFT_33576 [Hypoxylon sp. NC1633]|nr:hypothetical protein GGR54DRAFT_33576 [Hypoxylon sp. NC1633]
MAPTSKSSTSKTIASAKGNPAPNFAANMNLIQTQLEGRLKAIRPFLPSQPQPDTNPGGSNTNTNPSRTFSALNPSTISSASGPQSQPPRAAARAAEEADFAEERGLDPNTGIGSVPASSSAAPPGNGSGDRDAARLRGRLLGKRGRGAGGDGLQKWTRREESSDEEAGRGGLGRSRRSGKRSRAEMEGVDRERRDDDTDAPRPAPTMGEVENIDEPVGRTGSPEDKVEDLKVDPPKADESGQPISEGIVKKKRRKRKRNKKSKEKGE